MVKEEKPKVPLYGVYETKDVKEVNELVLSGEYIVRDIYQGKYYLKKIKCG